MQKFQNATKAVALAYNKHLSAPKVVAQGKNRFATILIQKALAFDIPIFQNKELVDLLINIEVDDFIDEECYLAVAKIFVWLNENEKKAQLS